MRQTTKVFLKIWIDMWRIYKEKTNKKSFSSRKRDNGREKSLNNHQGKFSDRIRKQDWNSCLKF